VSRARPASQGHIHRDAAATPDTTAAAVALTTAAATTGASSGAPGHCAHQRTRGVHRHDFRRSHRRPTVREWDWKPGTIRVGYAVGDHALVVSHVVLPPHRIPP